MINEIILKQNTSTSQEIERHLHHCDSLFTPALSQRVIISEYSAKLAEKADTFEAWEGLHLVGLIAAYLPEGTGEVAFITNVSIYPRWQRKGLGKRLMQYFIDFLDGSAISTVCLEVDQRNKKAITFYETLGFSTIRRENSLAMMRHSFGSAVSL